MRFFHTVAVARDAIKITKVWIFIFLQTDKPIIQNVTAVPDPACEGNKVTFNCNVTGNPTPYVAWMDANGTVLQNSTNVTSYTISEVTRNYEGNYTCEATNPVGEDVASTSLLDVQCKLVRKSLK